MTPSYAETLAWLYSLEAARGMDFKLERVALALTALGEPQREYPTIHIAGTNGKGSVAAMMHAILQASGRHTGLYTSPHLVRFTERIRVGEEEITEGEVVDLAQEIRSCATVRGIELTFFEFVTVLGFLSFARRRVDCAVIEVGLGGRLDATNVVDPLVSVITTIGIDHEEYLGDTIEQIAAEKGGIIKAERPVVLGQMVEPARRVLRKIADTRAVPVVEASRDIRSTAGADGQIRLEGLGWDLDGIRLNLRGRFQLENAVTAVAAAAVVRDRLGIDRAAIREGLSTVRWPGRFEVVATSPLVVLDGAHNEQGISALTAELPEVVGSRPVHLLFAVMRDKRWLPMVERLAPLVRSATITTVPPRGESPEQLAAQFRRLCPAVDVVADPRQAAATLFERVGADQAILVTGSLFLVGQIIPVLTQLRPRPFSPMHV
jgi:dihydrofolate synthase/folylpolyglutamate synthase